MKNYLLTIFIFTISNYAMSSIETIEKLDKAKKKIKLEISKKNGKIDKLNEELENITRNIIETTRKLNQKIEDVIKQQEELLSIQNDIVSTKRILTSIESSISNINFEINKKELEIKKQENNIKEKEKILNEIKKELDNRTRKAYDSGIKNNISKEDKKYLIDYYHFIQQEDLNLSNEYRKQKYILEDDKELLEQSKKNLKSEKKIMQDKKKTNDILIKNLKDTKKIKEKLLATLRQEKTSLDKRLNKNKKQKETTQNQIKEIKSLIASLLKDEKRNEKIKQDLIKKRQQQKQIISTNFKDMKGKLNWPVNGKVVTKYGIQINTELNTTTENIGIEIECKRNATAMSIMDGYVSKITFIAGMGNVIIINHGDDYKTIYSNIDGSIIENNDGTKTILSNIDASIKISEDQYLSNNYKVGTVGDNLIKTNGKLHFQIWYKDKNLNPESWLIRK
tara:strand:+ start:2173 stop:3525 length:1353 start_codon:yes stop_codon:yes gene_type:complete